MRWNVEQETYDVLPWQLKPLVQLGFIYIFLLYISLLLYFFIQEVMKDPQIAADGFTYEADAINGWLNSSHVTSPMTNLKLDHCDLIPNYALSYAIQEWQQQS